MKANLGVRAADNQARGPIHKPDSPGVAARARACHITQLKCAFRRGRVSPDDAVMAARQVLTWEKAAGIQRLVSKGCRLSFLKHPKNHVRNHLECSVTERTFVHGLKARAVLRFHFLNLCSPSSHFVLPGSGGGRLFSLVALTGNARDQGHDQRSQDSERTTKFHGTSPPSRAIQSSLL